MDPWAEFEEVKPAPKAKSAPPARDQWAGFEEVANPSARAFDAVDLITSAVTPVAPLLLAAQQLGGEAKRLVSGSRRAGFQGATFGAGDEALAAGRSVMPGGPTYDQALTEDRANVARFAKDEPVLSTASNLVGALGTSILAGRALPPIVMGGGGVSLPGNVMRMGGAGAAWGGASGFASGEGGPAARINAAIPDALLGGALGAGAPVAGAVGKAIAESGAGRWAGEHVVAPLARGAARVLDALTPKVSPASLSAAAPGGPKVPTGMDVRGPGAWLQGVADAAENTTTRGAQRRIAQALARDRMTPDQVGARLADLGDGATLMDAGGDAMRRLGRTINTMPGEGSQIMGDMLKARGRETAPRMIADINRVAGDDAPFLVTFGKAQNARSKAAKEAFDEARSAGLNLSDDMKRILEEAPAARRAWDRVVKEAADKGEKLTAVDVAHRVKQMIADQADAAFRNEGVGRKGAGDLAERWRGALHRANPKIEAADKAFAAESDVIDAMALGRRFMERGVNETGDMVRPEALAKLSAAQKEGFAVGVFDTMRSAADAGPDAARRLAKQLDESGGLRKRLVEVLGAADADKLFKAADRELTFQGTRNFVRGNSTSADKMMDVADMLGGGGGAKLPTTPDDVAMGVLGRGLEMLRRQGAGNEAIRNEIARLLSDGNLSGNALMLDRLAKSMAAPPVVPNLTTGLAGAAGVIRP